MSKTYLINHAKCFLISINQKINGININDNSLEIVSPEFDLITIGHAFTNKFTKQILKILLKRKIINCQYY